MRDFNECSWSEGAEAVLALLPRLTAVRGMIDSKPLRELSLCCASLIEGDVRRAAEACFSMTSALLRGGYRRVTGDLFKDMLLHKIFLEPHPFARMAASNRLDEALYNAMKDDLDILYNLRELTGETLYRFVQERYDELKRRSRPGKDPATRIAEAAWGGSAVRPAQDDPLPMMNLPLHLPNGAPNWRYGEEELRDNYAADEALEEMYHRFLESGLDWSGMVEDLWNFFAAYGSGRFLRERSFTWIRGGLFPMEDMRLVEAKPLLEQEYRACLNHLIAFMRGESAEPLLITGAEGMGKTTMLFGLADELPELRFIYVPECGSLTELMPLFDMLKDQPLKFMVALDDPDIGGFALRTIPVNVLLAACTDKTEKAAGYDFIKRVALPQMRLDGFADMVQKILDSEGISVPRDVIRSACVDHQVDSRGELTVCAAAAVAAKLAAND
ncbi:MAG: DUF815 domain-containing protein [Clostridia bacterium]|nr:DUF815 domain-containing protein [Clostridia bacterium]